MAENPLGRFINRIIKKKITHREVIVKPVIKTKSITTTTKELNHDIVSYNDKQYVVCCIPYVKQHKMFIIDIDDKDKVIDKSWHYAVNNYIRHTYYGDENIKKDLYLHNLVMNKMSHDGKGQQHTIDHINRIGTDNRKVNLRNVDTQSAQNFNQKRRKRTAELPPDCGITLDQLPKTSWYGKAHGLHGDFICIEIKGVPTVGNGHYIWKSTKSTKVNLKLKLQQTLDHITELKQQYPELKNILVDEITEEQRHKLIEEYNDILKLSHYPQDVINDNLKKFQSETVSNNVLEQTVEQNNDQNVDQNIDQNVEQNNDQNVEQNNDQNVEQNNDKSSGQKDNLIPEIKNDEYLELEKIKKVKKAGKKKYNLPPDCGINPADLPDHCYFKPEDNKRGCKFIIDRHKALIALGKRQWSTPERKNLTILEKFELLKKKITELEQNNIKTV
jgi:uncharacterized protein (DUF924 family)